MSHTLIAIAVLIAAGCSYYLLSSFTELENFFLTRWLGQRCFPKLDPVRRQKRMQLLSGITLVILMTLAVVYFLITRMNRR
jgi:hypothetical protein